MATLDWSSGMEALRVDMTSTTPSVSSTAGRGAVGIWADTVLSSASDLVGMDFLKALRKVGVPNVSVKAIPRTPSPKQPTQYLSAVSFACT